MVIVIIVYLFMCLSKSLSIYSNGRVGKNLFCLFKWNCRESTKFFLNGPRNRVCSVPDHSGRASVVAPWVQARQRARGYAGEAGELLGVLLLSTVGYFESRDVDTGVLHECCDRADYEWDLWLNHFIIKMRPIDCHMFIVIEVMSSLGKSRC
jgi:hypothetical protein